MPNVAPRWRPSDGLIVDICKLPSRPGGDVMSLDHLLCITYSYGAACLVCVTSCTHVRRLNYTLGSLKGFDESFYLKRLPALMDVSHGKKSNSLIGCFLIFRKIPNIQTNEEKMLFCVCDFIFYFFATTLKQTEHTPSHSHSLWTDMMSVCVKWRQIISGVVTGDQLQMSGVNPGPLQQPLRTMLIYHS